MSNNDFYKEIFINWMVTGHRQLQSFDKEIRMEITGNEYTLNYSVYLVTFLITQMKIDWLST